MNISLILEMAAGAEPERIGLVCDGRRWSYGALFRAALAGIPYVPLPRDWRQHG